MTPPGFDIFCRVVDNYGDIGVCWRLARQLAQHPQAGPVRLWVDDLASFARIEQRVDPGAPRQHINAVELLHWTDPAPDAAPHDVVIEAFACDPPPSFLGRMQHSLWINLEYLSAESWVEQCHGLPSLQANGLQKFFFFPGFTARTGGLLREPALLSAQTEWNAQPELRWRLMRDIGMPVELIDHLRSGWRQAFVFCYSDAPAESLAQALNQTGQPTIAIVPPGVLPRLAAVQSERLKVHQCPFVNQDRFDRLLWSSDLNIVRGEDSLVRAIWAGKPFLWHIYRQDGNAHLVKLDAWLAGTGYAGPIRESIRAWNVGGPHFARSLEHSLQAEQWMQWRQDCLTLRAELASQASLVERVLAFSTENARSG